METTLEDAFLLYFEKRQVIKMMFKYELKRSFLSGLIRFCLRQCLGDDYLFRYGIRSMRYVDEEGKITLGLNQDGFWLKISINGKELTAEKISEVINDYKTISANIRMKYKYRIWKNSTVIL